MPDRAAKERQMRSDSAPTNGAEIFDRAFYERHGVTMKSSAEVVVPLVVSLLQPASVVDVGCGEGFWLQAFSNCAVRSILGIDGDYIDRRRLVIPPERFIAADLSHRISVPGTFDLAICLEVTPYLSQDAGDALVATLAAAAPVVFFSAALPGQGGDNHINEQWPSYWIERFSARGYTMIDAVRPQIREDSRVAWYYRQNLMIFASARALDAHPALRGWSRTYPEMGLEWVHVNSVPSHLSDLTVLQRAPGALRRKIVRVARRIFLHRESA